MCGDSCFANLARSHHAEGGFEWSSQLSLGSIWSCFSHLTKREWNLGSNVALCFRSISAVTKAALVAANSMFLSLWLSFSWAITLFLQLVHNLKVKAVAVIVDFITFWKDTFKLHTLLQIAIHNWMVWRKPIVTCFILTGFHSTTCAWYHRILNSVLQHWVSGAYT